jgi:hypothetical protein
MLGGVIKFCVVTPKFTTKKFPARKMYLKPPNIFFTENSSINEQTISNPVQKRGPLKKHYLIIGAFLDPNKNSMQKRGEGGYPS